MGNLGILYSSKIQVLKLTWLWNDRSIMLHTLSVHTALQSRQLLIDSATSRQSSTYPSSLTTTRCPPPPAPQCCPLCWCRGTASSTPSTPCCRASATRCSRTSRTCPRTPPSPSPSPPSSSSSSSSSPTPSSRSPTRPGTATPPRRAAAAAAPPSPTPPAARTPAAPSRCQVQDPPPRLNQAVTASVQFGSNLFAFCVWCLVCVGQRSKVTVRLRHGRRLSPVS